ncbi:hypothetical protein GF377_00750 [candidate division GN15 bacterium]|nr:hypothetical protein [candidate division GN15 bacterium]
MVSREGVVVISFEFVLYCLLAAGLYLLVISFVLEWVERLLNLRALLPEGMAEKTGVGMIISNFILEVLFYVAIPTLIYSFFYFLIPFSGFRAGMAATLFAFVLGTAPTIMGLSVRVKLPLPYLLFVMLSVLIKLGGCMLIIAYLYSL